MKSSILALGLFAGLSVCSVASASIVWNFSGTSLQNNGYSPSPTGGTGTISAYAFQMDANGNLLSTPTTDANHGPYGTPTLDGLFQVDNFPYGEGSGIAPYNPTEGGGFGFPFQDGITDTVGNVGSQFKNGPYDNFLELQLGANIPAGTTLTFLMQHGDGDGSLADVNVFSEDGTVGSGVAPSGMKEVWSDVAINGHTNTVGQFTITTDGKAEVIAIEADCHYLLLDTITGTPSTVPEPRCYGILLAGMLGLAMVVYNRKRVTE
jgi:hypothetical protein